ncbi:MAG TPA: DUF488 domain-containing protein [Casimicrobiaceae bacterium]|nr:DUF488 domain-containing protein [Casimicrobiaceae bacterium]
MEGSRWRDDEIRTIGHSNRTLDTFVDLLERHGVERVVDVRTVPRSRRHPHFGIDQLPAALAARYIEYVHLAGLGGLRKPKPDSINTGWRNLSFRGYADHMCTAAFTDDLARLIDMAQLQRCVVMCAEAVPWQCHRSLIADALVARGIPVSNILGPQTPTEHRITPFARMDGENVTYPALAV